jgi:hypothetical protein
MDYKKELETALECIEKLNEALSWVGGDSYEVECVANMTEGVDAFLSRHRPPPENIDTSEPDKRLGKYALRENLKRTVYANNKRHAKNLLGVSLKNVICLEPPLSRLQVMFMN